MIIFPVRCIYVNYVNWIEVSVTPGIYNPQQKYQRLIMLMLYRDIQLNQTLDYATVGASLLMKAMLCRQSLLTNSGQAGFIIICSTTILSSLNKILQNKNVSFRNTGKSKIMINKQILMMEFTTAFKESEEIKLTGMHTMQFSKSISMWFF